MNSLRMLADEIKASEKSLQGSGNVSFFYGDNTVKSDKVIFDRENNILEFKKNIIYKNNFFADIYSNRLVYDVDTSRISLYDVYVNIATKATLLAKKIEYSGKDYVFSNVSYTSL